MFYNVKEVALAVLEHPRAWSDLDWRPNVSDSTPFKTCTKCGKSFPATAQYFHNNRKKLRPDCKQCACARALVWHEANREKANKGRVARRLANADQERETKRTWARANKAWTREYNKRYRLEHLEKISQRVKRWIHDNPERYAAARRRWVARNIEKVNKSKLISIERRRAVKALVSSDLTVAEWGNIVEVYGHRCAYCGARFDNLQIEHVIPISRGGGHTASNVVPACQKCNLKKSYRTPEEAGMTFAIVLDRSLEPCAS